MRRLLKGAPDMVAADLLFLVTVLAVGCFFPGFFCVRRLAWSPIEKVCGSIALSLFLIYLWSFLGYILRTPVWWSWLATAAALVMGFASRRELAMLFHNRTLRRSLLGFGCLVVWALALLALVRSVSGGAWYGDWYEHYQRTVLFLERGPAEVALFGGYVLPSRPPLMNLLAAHFLAHTAAGFPHFQVAFAFLNLLVFFPLALVLRSFAPRARASLATLTALLALNPFFIQNATYTWTKLLAAFFVVFATWLYASATRRHDATRMVAAFAALAAGALVHYGAGPAALFFAGHYLIVVWRRRAAKWREVIAITVVSGTVLATWITWSIAKFGVYTTVAANTAVQPTGSYAGGTLAKIVFNIVDTVVPHPLRGVPLSDITQPNRLGLARDYAFEVYQTNLIFAMGIIGGLAFVAVLSRDAFRRSVRATADRSPTDTSAGTAAAT